MEETKKKGSGTTDLTVGRPLTRILQFALPLVLGTLFQQLYSFVDTIIVGRCIGTDALGAVGTTYSLNFMIVGFVLATCNGFGIPVAESFGAKDRDDLHKYLFNGAVLCVGMSLVFAVGTTLVAAPLLQLIHTPAELLENAVRYIRIIFLGIPATVLYNYSSTVLRSLGDSKHPFYFLLVSSFLNIALDVLFIVPLGMGVEGAAIATVISQLVSGILCTWWFFTKVEDIHFTRENCVLSGRHCKRLAYIGFPMGFEYSVSAIGAVIMQDAINQLGSVRWPRRPPVRRSARCSPCPWRASAWPWRLMWARTTVRAAPTASDRASGTAASSRQATAPSHGSRSSWSSAGPWAWCWAIPNRPSSTVRWST